MFNFGSKKFVIKDANPNQHMLQVKGENLFLRGFTTITDLGKSYNIGTIGAVLNESWNRTSGANGSGRKGWLQEYYKELGVALV